MNTRVADERLHHRHHAVQFYGDETELFKTVGTFLSEGLVAGQPAIVIATPDHAAAIQEALSSHLIDVPRARHLGDLVMLDAEETLGTFMHNGMPDKILFQRHAGALMEQTVRGRGRMPLRAYGEMVDVLWRRGRPTRRSAWRSCGTTSRRCTASRSCAGRDWELLQGNLENRRSLSRAHARVRRQRDPARRREPHPGAV